MQIKVDYQTCNKYSRGELLRRGFKTSAKVTLACRKQQDSSQGEDRTIMIPFMPYNKLHLLDFWILIDSNKTTGSKLLNLPLFDNQTQHSFFQLHRKSDFTSVLLTRNRTRGAKKSEEIQFTRWRKKQTQNTTRNST